MDTAEGESVAAEALSSAPSASELDATDGRSGWMAAHHHQLGPLDATNGGALALSCAMLALAYQTFAFVGETADGADSEIGAALVPLVLSSVVLLLLLLHAFRDIRYYLGGTPIPRTLVTKPHDTPDERLLNVGRRVTWLVRIGISLHDPRVTSSPRWWLNEQYCLFGVCYELALVGMVLWLAFSTHPGEMMEVDCAAFDYDAVVANTPSAELAARLTAWSRCLLGFFALLLTGACAAAAVRIATRNGARLDLLTYPVSMLLCCGIWPDTDGYLGEATQVHAIPQVQMSHILYTAAHGKQPYDNTHRSICCLRAAAPRSSPCVRSAHPTRCSARWSSSASPSSMPRGASGSSRGPRRLWVGLSVRSGRCLVLAHTDVLS